MESSASVDAATANPADDKTLPTVEFGQAAAQPDIFSPLPAKLKPDVYSGDYLIIGIGAAALPAYEGSRRHHIIPAFGLGGRIHGIGISPRTLGFAFNLVPPRRSRIGFSLGPVIRWHGGRVVEFSDPTPVQIGNAKGNLELGLSGSIGLKHVFSKYDSVSIGSDVRFDASAGTGSIVVSPGMSYFTPISHSQVVSISAGADIYNDRFATQSYAVKPSSKNLSGVVTQTVTVPGGLRSIGGRIFTAYDLDHNLLNGGFSIVFGIGYTRLLGAAARSPLVKNGGSHDQIVVGTGLAFAFKTGR